MCRGSALGARIRTAEVPLLGHAAALAQDACRTGAAVRNWDSYGSEVDPGKAEGWQRDLLCDPQTSGGLLVAVARHCAEDVMAAIRAAGFVHAAIIGEMVEGLARIELI
jgi:selenide,water dikinase